MEKHRILVINPGSTSTKIAVYDDEQQIFTQNIIHDGEELREKFADIFDQYEYRKELIFVVLADKGVAIETINIVMAIGGLLPPVPAGAIEVSEDMCLLLKNHPRNKHASNLGAPIALSIAQPLGIKAYVYDPITVDQLDPIARISGIKEITRTGLGHALNMRACAMKYAREKGRDYSDMKLIVAHLGGGVTLSCHSGGRMVEMVSDEDGPFSGTRTGGLPLFEAISLFSKKEMTYDMAMKEVKDNGGLMSYLGVSDTREVEKMINGGNAYAALIYEAMAYQVARCIGSLAPVVDCKPDAIILTGGIAYSGRFPQMVEKRVAALAPVVIMAGEFEMEALAKGGLRVLRGDEQPSRFIRAIE